MVLHSGWVQDIDPKIQAQFRTLNLKDGYMRLVLRECKNGNPLFRDGEVAYFIHEGKVQAWALLFKLKDQHILYIYTRYDARKRGYGSQLAEWAVNKYPNIRAHTMYSNIFGRAGVKGVKKDYVWDIPWD